MSQDKGEHGVCETVKVVSKVVEGNENGYVVINKADFVEGEHELYKEPKAKKAAAEKEEDTGDAFDEMNVAELKAWLKDAGVAVGQAKTKEDLQALCRANAA